jgi:predicted phage terminase large subunit-like protein
LVKDKDYTYNKTEKVIEFVNGTLLEFKTADDPQSLRGAGLDILWIDEAAFVPNDEAWNVVYPALVDKPGQAITTTTPAGKNWFYEKFWSEEALADVNEFRVEYTSIDNPFLPKDIWEQAKKSYHPIMFKQEFLAAFDAFHGVALHGDWLKYYVVGKNTPLGSPDDIRLDLTNKKLAVFIGVDPILGPLPGHAYGGGDRFAMAAVGVDLDAGQVYLIEMLAMKELAFPDQIMKIAEWHTKYRPQLIGVESNAFQRAFVQQLSRLPGVPNVIPVFAKGKKHERILAMTPLFRTGRVRIHRNHRDFIDEWVSYDPTAKNPKDDALDAVEIALGCAGIILPATLNQNNLSFLDKPAADIQELASREVSNISPMRRRGYDEDMGDEY